MRSFYLLISHLGTILADAKTPLEATQKQRKLRDNGTEASIYFCHLVSGEAVTDIAAAFSEVEVREAGR